MLARRPPRATARRLAARGPWASSGGSNTSALSAGRWPERSAGRAASTCHSGGVAEAGSYYNVWLTMKDSETVDEFYKYPEAHLPQVGEIIKVVRFLRDRPTRARVTHVDEDFNFRPRITANQI